MTFLPKVIARVRSAGRSAIKIGNPPLVYGGGEMSRSDAMWDEALIAAMHCEAARLFLDYMGPRWK